MPLSFPTLPPSLRLMMPLSFGRGLITIHLGALFGLSLLSRQEILCVGERIVCNWSFPTSDSPSCSLNLGFVRLNTIGIDSDCWQEKLYRENLGAVPRYDNDSNRFSVKRSSDLPHFSWKCLVATTGGGVGEPVRGKNFCYFRYFCKDCKFWGFVLANSTPHTPVDVWGHSFLSLDIVKLPHKTAGLSGVVCDNY